MCVLTQLHRLKQQLQEEVFHASSAAELPSKAHNDLYCYGRHLLSCQEQPAHEGQHCQDSVQGLAKELSNQQDHDCSSTQAMTRRLDGHRIWAHEEDHPDDSLAGQDSLPRLTREDSSSSAISAYSAEHLADAWEAIMCKSRGQAPAVQLQLSAEPYHLDDEALDSQPQLGCTKPQTAAGKDLSGCSKLVKSEASATLLSLYASQEDAHTGTASTASSISSLTALCPFSLPGSLDRCAYPGTGAEQGHSSPAYVWSSCSSRTGAAPWKPSFSSSVADLSDSEDDDELARLEAKYGIPNMQL